MASDDDADDDDDGDDDGDHDDDDEDADVGVDVDVDGDELAALFSHYCSSSKSNRLYCITDPCTWHVAAWKACVGNDLRPHGCGKPVAAMACGRWLWKACGCNGLWPLLVESLSSWGLLPRALLFSGTVSADRT